MKDQPQSLAERDARVEIGWILPDQMTPPHRDAAHAAARRMREHLACILPDFDWHVDLTERHEAERTGPAEPVLLLDDAELERDRHCWDFVLILTERELVSYMRPTAVAAPARIFSTAVVSVARVGDDEETLARRLFALAMHLFGRLNGLGQAGAGFMRDFGRLAELDDMEGYDENELADLRRSLAAVADPRVEEMQGQRRSVARFYLQSLWENRRALPGAVLRMRPWAFPARLTRLTTAAGSALAVLMMTAESWEVAANLAPATIATLSTIAFLATSAYLLKAQRLLARPGEGVLREQRAVSNAGTVIAVALGMAMTYLAIFALAYAAGMTLFHDPLLSGWVGDGAEAVRPRMAGFTAALSLIIGALGASFEPHGYFRHVTHIDDEI